MAEIKRILVSQPKPAILEKSPFFELANKYDLEVDYRPLIEVKGVTPKEFRSQRVEILAHTAVIFTSRTTIDSFFRICEDARITVPETLKYICSTEAIALYLQKYIVYRKRKISFADGTFTGIVEQIVKHKDEKRLYIYPTDQAPYKNAGKHPIGEFMHQPTNVMLGSVGVACKLAHAVVYMKMRRLERGKYEMTFIPICKDASLMPPEEMMRKYYDLLEQELNETPCNWLWSHKRWK